MQSSPQSIVFDCERMKYPHTGLYQFCLQLSQAMLRVSNDLKLCFYTPSAVGKLLGETQCYLQQHGWHKFFFPSVKNIALWHCAHQDSDYFPFGKKTKTLLTIHDLNYFHDNRKTEKKRLDYLHRVQRKIEEADHLVFISQFSLNDTRENLQITGKKTSVIYNGCNIKELPSLTQPPYFPPKPFLLTLGTITYKKNFHVLPRLLPGNDFLLVIAGITQSEAYKEKILREAQKLGVSNRLIFTGPVWENDKQWYLKHCSAFVFPSLAEGFGLPVLEAMYFEKPVLLSKATSLPEIGGSEADYFPSFDASDMQNTLAYSLQNFETNAGKKLAMKKRALSFSWDEAAKKYLEIYSSLTNQTEK